MDVLYFSGSGNSKAVATYLSERLGCKACELKCNYEGSEAVIVFPVYCQNIPKHVKAILKRIKLKRVGLVATYGGISYGNVIYEAEKILNSEVISFCYLKMSHSVLQEEKTFDFSDLEPFIESLKEGKSVKVKKEKKNPLANLFPELRSRLGIKIIKNRNCIACGKCNSVCSIQAIDIGEISGKCMRCLACVYACERCSLEIKLMPITKSYLKLKK